MRVLQGIFIAGLTLVVAFYMYQKSTPEFALKRLVEALEERDKAEVLKYADKGLIIDGVIEEYLEKHPEANSAKVTSQINTFGEMAFSSHFLPEKFSQERRIDFDIKILELKKLADENQSAVYNVTIVKKTTKEKRTVKIRMRKLKEWKLVSVDGLSNELGRILLL